MKSVVIHGKRDIRPDDAPTPTPRPGEVRLDVAYVGICGSDVHYYFDGANGEYVVREPLTPGHEMSGVVDLDPSGHYRPGTRVTVHPARFGAPVPGLEASPQLWPGGDYLGSAAQLPHRQGTAAEYLDVDQSMIRAVPDAVPLQRAALAEPLAVALHAVALAGRTLTGKQALVIGTGPIGLLAIAVAHRAGADAISASDLHVDALTRAHAVGASQTIVAGDHPVPDGSYDVVFECSGAAPAVNQAIQAVRPGGAIVQVGVLPNAELGINLAPLLAKEAALRGAFRFASEIDDAIAMLAETPSLDSVITHVVKASAAGDAFALARDSRASAKVLLEFDQLS